MKVINATILMSILAVYGDNKQQNETEIDEKPPTTRVHLIREIGVAMIETDNKLTNGEKTVQLALDFKNNFFENLELEHEACSQDDSSIKSEATKAIIRGSQEFYQELLNQLTSRLEGTRGTRSTNTQRIVVLELGKDPQQEKPPTIEHDNVYENSYEETYDYGENSENNNFVNSSPEETVIEITTTSPEQQATQKTTTTTVSVEATPQEEELNPIQTTTAAAVRETSQEEDYSYGRTKTFLITKTVGNKSIVQTGENLFNTEKQRNTVINGKMQYFVFSKSFIQLIRWTEETSQKQLQIIAKKYICNPTCTPIDARISTQATRIGNKVTYESVINQESVLLQFSTNATDDIILSKIEIIGITSITKLGTVRIKDRTINAAFIKAPRIFNSKSTTEKNETSLTEPYFIFDRNTNHTICKAMEDNSIKNCIYHISAKDITSRQHNIRVEAEVTLNYNSRGRKRRGLLEMLKTGRFFASDYAEDRIENEVDLEKQKDALLTQEIKTISDMTKHVVETTEDQFDILGASICLIKSSEQASKIEGILIQKISRAFALMNRVVEDCSFGRVTTEIDTNHLQTLCTRYMMPATKCKNMSPVNLRKLFECKSATLNLKSYGVRINLSINFPNIVESKAMEIVTIPVFVKGTGTQQTKMLILEESIIFETNTGYQSFDTCQKKGGITMCDLHEERSKDSLNCIKALLNDDYESANLHCETRTEFTKDKCYSRNTIAGELVSTQEQMHDQTKIFEPTPTGKGVLFIKKQT